MMEDESQSSHSILESSLVSPSIPGSYADYVTCPVRHTKDSAGDDPRRLCINRRKHEIFFYAQYDRTVALQ
jgi:hypothetical protein